MEEKQTTKRKSGSYYQRKKQERLEAERLQNQSLGLKENQVDSNSNQNVSEGLGVEIEPQGEQDMEPGFRGLLSRASRKLQGLGDVIESPDDKKPTRVSKGTREDFSVLVVSLVTLSITFWRIPEQIKPDSSEIDLFSDHLSGILLRHLPINKKLSADALDIIGLMAVTATWYSRVSPDVQLIRDARANGQTVRRVGVQERVAQPIPNDPIGQVSAEVADWLNNAASKGANNGNYE